MNKKAEKAKALRYKKVALEELNFDTIQSTLSEVSEECDNFRYAFHDESLLSALDGDDEEEWEYRMLFSDLSAECEQLYYLLDDTDIPELFDNVFVGIMLNNKNPFEMVGYDSYEEDYYSLVNRFDRNSAENESFKRLMRLSKKELIDLFGRCFAIAMCYMNVTRKYDYLKAAFDVLRDKNIGFLETIKGIEKAYELAQENGRYSEEWREFERLCEALPDRSWVE